jgi:putative transcriptional regulator
MRPRLRHNLFAWFCTLAFLLHAAWSRSAGDHEALTALILSARAEVADENFASSTVLVLNNLGPAPIGLITNRPTKFLVSELFPDLAQHLARIHGNIYFGGPVEIDTVWFLVRASKPPDHALRAFDDVYISANRELLLQLLDRSEPMRGLRIFIGHAGWAPGQLESEIARGDWALARASSEAIFSKKSDHPWPSASAPTPAT